MDGKDNRDARAQRQLALCAGPHGIPITAERIVSGGADQMIEHLFSKNALVDPIKAKNPTGWLYGERTLTGAELIGAINLAIKELELTLK